MFRRTTFTTITPLPLSLSRDVVVTFLHDHLEMIDLNPLVKERHPIPPPPHAEPEEQTCVWYSLTDKISYLPGDLYTGDVTYTCAFRDLPDGLQTHCYAPAGLNIRDSWTVHRSQPAEFRVGPGLGAPEAGLYIREEVDMRCNMLLTAFVRRTLKKSHAALVERLKVRAQTGSKAAPATATAGMWSSGLSGPGGPSSSIASERVVEGHVGSSTTNNGPGTDQGVTVAGPGVSGHALSPEERRLRTPSPNPGGVSAEAMQYYRHWEAPSSSPPPPPRKNSPPPSKDRPATDPPNLTPKSSSAKSHQRLDTPQLLAPQRRDADQQPLSGPGRSPSTAGLVPAPLRIRSRSPPQQRVQNPPIAAPPPPSTAEVAAAAAAPERVGGQAVPEVEVLEDSPIGARLKGPFVAQLP